jgi:hypothetical protein
MTSLVVNDLLPDALEKTTKIRAATAFMIGVALMIVVGRTVGL